MDPVGKHVESFKNTFSVNGAIVSHSQSTKVHTSFCIADAVESIDVYGTDPEGCRR